MYEPNLKIEGFDASPRINMSTISVAVTTYNYEKYLPQCLKSIFSQTRLPNEILVVDDCSSDNTEKIMKNYKNKVKYIRFKKNHGIVCKTYNKGLKKAKGDYLLWISADDWLHPEILEREAKILDTHPNIGMVYSQAYDMVNGKKQLIIHEASGKKMYLGRDEEFKLLLTKGNYIPCLTALVRKKVYEDVGYFDEKLNVQGDWELWIRIAKKYPIAYLPKPLAYYRIHGKNIHLQKKRQAKAEKEWLYTLKKNLKKETNVRLKNEAYYYLFLKMAAKKISKHHFRLGNKYIIKAIKLMPQYIVKWSSWQPYYFTARDFVFGNGLSNNK